MYFIGEGSDAGSHKRPNGGLVRAIDERCTIYEGFMDKDGRQ